MAIPSGNVDPELSIERIFRGAFGADRLRGEMRSAGFTADREWIEAFRVGCFRSELLQGSDVGEF